MRDPEAERLEAALADLRSLASEATLKGYARYAIPAENAIGVSMANLKLLAKKLGKSHELAAGLWATGIYEARMLATLVDEPAKVSVEQMERWALEFDSWAICDTACFCLFDRTPQAWSLVEAWAERPEEFVKRAAFALLASLVLHAKKAPDEKFLHGLLLIEAAAADERNFVKKAVNWALRTIGKKNASLHAAALEVAERLAAAQEPAQRWVGKDALRELKSEAVDRRLEAKRVAPARQKEEAPTAEIPGRNGAGG